MSETVVYRRGTLRARRQQIHMQGRLHIRQERARYVIIFCYLTVTYILNRNSTICIILRVYIL